MSIYNLLNIGRWTTIFEREFPDGHFLPLPENVVLTQAICDKFPLTIYGAVVKQKGLVRLFSVDEEPLVLNLDGVKETMELPVAPRLDMPTWELKDVIRYVLESWFSAIGYLDQQGKFKDLVFALSKNPYGEKSNLRITYRESERSYRAKVIPSGMAYYEPTEIHWNDCNLHFKVGKRDRVSTGTTYLLGDSLPVPTKYIIFDYLNKLVGRNGGIEDLDVSVFRRLLREETLWLDANATGDDPVYGMATPPDSTSHQREMNKGQYLTAPLKGDSGRYPMYLPRKFAVTDEGGESSRHAIQKAHQKGIPLLPEKNGGIRKSLVCGHKGVNNCFIGLNKGRQAVINYLADPGKPEKMLNRVHTGTGGNKAQMEGLEGSNIYIKNVDGTLTRHYGYPIDYFICLGRGYGGNSGVVPVRKDFHIPYKVRKQFIDTVYLDNIPPNSAAAVSIEKRSKLYRGSRQPMVEALADYIRHVVSTQVIPLLQENPQREWKNEYLLTLFGKGDNPKPLKVFQVSGNNRAYSFEDGVLDVEDFIQVGNGCVHLSAEMFFKGKKGEPFKLRMLGGKATTLPCEFRVLTQEGDQLVPYSKPIDVLMSNECIKGPALWWIAFAQLNGPCYLSPNEGLMEVSSTGEVVDFLQPNNQINHWLEENSEEVFIEYEVCNEVLNVLRQEPEFIQELGETNPHADIQILKTFKKGALVRERVIGIHARIPLGYVELSTAAEKVGSSTLTSQQFAGIGMLNPQLLQGLVDASSWKRDVVEKMIEVYIKGGNVGRKVLEGKSEQLILRIFQHLMKEVTTKSPELTSDKVRELALKELSTSLSSNSGLIALMESVFPDGFTYTIGGTELPICLPILQVYSRRDSISRDVVPITAQVLSVIRKLGWAFIQDVNDGVKEGRVPNWSSIRQVEKTINLIPISQSIRGWMRALLGDVNSDSKVIAALGRITACGQATAKTSFEPCVSNLQVEQDGETYPIPVFYIHPDDDLLYVLFGNDVPETNDPDKPYFVAVTRTPLGYWTFGRLIISKKYGWKSHITCNCVVIQQGSETDGDGDLLTMIPVTMYDSSLTYRDIHTYNASYIGYLGYGLHGKDSTLRGFYEAKSKWGKQPFRTKQHSLIKVKGYEQPDFVGVVPMDQWGHFAHYAQGHYRVNVGSAYSVYSNVCFACSKEVEEFRQLCLEHIPDIHPSSVIELLSNVLKLEAIEVEPRLKQRIVSKGKTVIAHLVTLSLTCRVMYEGMGLSGYKPKAYSIFSLYLALVNNPSGRVIGYKNPEFGDYLLFLRENDTRNISELPDEWIQKNDKGLMKVMGGVKLLTNILLPEEVRNVCLGTHTQSDLVYDPICNSFDTYKNGMFIGMEVEVISILRRAALWGFIYQRMKIKAKYPGTEDDILQAICYRVLRDFTSGSIGNDVYSIMELGEEASVSLYMWSLINQPDAGWKDKIYSLIPNPQLREMVLRALPLLELVFLYKQNQVMAQSVA